MEKPKSRGPSAIGDLIAELFPQKSFPKGMNEEMDVFKIWCSVVGPEVAKQTKPKRLINGTLFVETVHPIWTMELQGKSHLIRKKINTALGRDAVKEIFFRQARQN